MTDFYCEAQFWLYISFGFIGKSAETLVLISFFINYNIKMYLKYSESYISCGKRDLIYTISNLTRI